MDAWSGVGNLFLLLVPRNQSNTPPRLHPQHQVQRDTWEAEQIPQHSRLPRVGSGLFKASILLPSPTLRCGQQEGHQQETVGVLDPLGHPQAESQCCLSLCQPHCSLSPCLAKCCSSLLLPRQSMLYCFFLNTILFKLNLGERHDRPTGKLPGLLAHSLGMVALGLHMSSGNE